MKIFSGTSNQLLAGRIAGHLGTKLSGLEVFEFPDGEKRVRILDRVVDEDTVVVQSTSTPVDENYMQLFFIIDALKRGGAKSVTAVVPYFGYQRQDHIFREGEDVSVKMVAGILSRMELKEVVSVDFHSVKIREAFSIPAVELSALPLFAKTIKEKGLDEGAFLVSPDMGGIRRIKILSELLGDMPYVVIEKNRDLTTGAVSADKFSGQIGKKAIIVDDMISSGGTIAVAADLLKKNGVQELYVFATHAVFSSEAPKVLQASGVNSVYVSDSVFVPIEKMFPKLEILSLSQVIADRLKS